MHPAFSVLIFTVTSGAGYGLLAWLGAGQLLGYTQGLYGRSAAEPRCCCHGACEYWFGFVYIALG